MAQTSYTQPVIAKKLSGVSQQIVTGSAIYYGLDINDDDAGQVHVHIYNRTSNTGVLIGSSNPPNGEHDTHWVGPNGILCPNGIYVEVVSGTPEGSIFYR